MITRMRNVFKSISIDQRWKRHLLKSAKEIAFIMMGVLLALFFRNINLEKKDRAKEKHILLEMKNDLIKDHFDVSWNIDCGSRIMNATDLIVDHLESEIPYHDTLSSHYDMLYYHIQFESGIAAYEQLKSSGFQIVLNNELRQLIIELYAKQYEIVRRREDNLLHPFYVNRITNEMHSNVIFDMKDGRVTPNDVEALYENTSFIESLKSDYIFKSIERNKYLEIKEIMESILIQTDQEYPNNKIPYCRELAIFGSAVMDSSGYFELQPVDKFAKQWKATISLQPGELKFIANDNNQMTWGSDIPGFISSFGKGIQIERKGNYEVSFNIHNWTFDITKQ